MSSSTPVLNWPRSDGDKSRWPPRETNNESWNEKMPGDSAKYDLYQSKIGQYFAEKYNYPGAQKFKLAMPSGYALFNHCKPQPDGSVREDSYLYGSTIVMKFRSPAEFIPHAEWLMDTALPMNNHSTCRCKYSPSGEKKSGAGSPVKRSQNSPQRSAKKPKPEAKERSNSPQPSSIVPERASDLRSGRRFRKGELVFFKMDTTIQPPEGTDLPPITHWPGLIAQIKYHNSSTTTSQSQAMAVSWDYQIRPLGMMSNACDIVRNLTDLLPWSMHPELLGGVDGWKAVGTAAETILNNGVERELDDIKIKGKQVELGPLENGKPAVKRLDERWKKRWAERIQFPQLPKEWDISCFRLAVALKTGTMIVNAWTQTDKIELGGLLDVLPEVDRAAITQRSKALYQGLWLGGERIWVDDVVRLKKRRAELPQDHLFPPTADTLDKAVFFKIDSISVEVVEPPSTQDTDATLTDPTAAWRCLLYGDAYELITPGPISSRPVPNGTSSNPISIDSPTAGSSSTPALVEATRQIQTKPPAGFEYRQINPEGYEVTVDVVDVAGRAYPDLVENSSWLRDPAKATDSHKIQAGETAHALMGLRPGDTASSSSEKWKEDLYSIVSDATRTIEREMKEYYFSILVKQLDEIPDQGVPPATLNQAML